MKKAILFYLLTIACFFLGSELFNSYYAWIGVFVLSLCGIFLSAGLFFQFGDKREEDKEKEPD